MAKHELVSIHALTESDPSDELYLVKVAVVCPARGRLVTDVLVAPGGSVVMGDPASVSAGLALEAEAHVIAHGIFMRRFMLKHRGKVLDALAEMQGLRRWAGESDAELRRRVECGL